METGTTLLPSPQKHLKQKAIFFSYLLLSTVWVGAQPCTIAGLPTACENTTEQYTNTLQGANLDFIWILPTGGAIIPIPNTENSIFVSWNFPGIHTLSCDVLENGELVATCQVEVNVKELPVGNLFFDPPGWMNPTDLQLKNYCVGDNIDIIMDMRVPDPEAIFVWRFIGADVIDQSAGAMSNVTLVEAGNLQVCVDISLANCVSTFCQNVRVYPIPDPVDFEVIESNSGTVCGNQDIYFINTSIGDVPDDAWLWKVDDGTNVWTFRSRDLSFPFQGSGSYDISLQYMPYSNCSSEPVTQSVVIEDLLPLVVGCPTTICFGETVTYELLTECGGVIDWGVSPEGTVISENGNEIEISWNNETGNDYGFLTVSATDCGSEYCASPTVLVVPLFPPNMIEIDGPDMLCGDFTYTVNGPPGANYLWSPTLVSTIQGTINLPTSSASSYTVNVGDFIGTIQLSIVVSHPSLECTSSDEIEVDIYSVSIESTDEICYGSPYDVAITPPMPGMDIDWVLFYNNQFLYEVTDDDTYTFPAEQLIIPGVYTLRAELTNAPNQPCVVEKMFTVIAPLTPITEIIGPTEICPGQTELYSVVNAEGNVFWTVHGGAFQSPLNPNNPTTAIGPNQLVTWDNTTSPKYLTAYRFVGQCTSETITLQVEEFELNDIMIMGDPTACSDGISEYTASFDGSADFLWSVFPANIGSVLPPAPGDPPSLVRIRWHYTPMDIPVFVQVTAIDCFEAGMSAMFEVTLTAFEFTIENNNTITCAGEPIAFTTNAATATSWEWTVDGNSVPSNNGPGFSYTFDHPGQYIVEVIANSPDGCGGEYQAAYEVDVYGLESPSLSLSPALSCPNPVFPIHIISSIGTSGNFTYVWFRNGNEIPGEDEPTLAVNELGIYMLQISDGVCTRTGEIILECTPPPPPCPCTPTLNVSIDNIDIGNCGAYTLYGTIDDFNEAESAFWTLHDDATEIVTTGNPVYHAESPGFPGHYEIMLTAMFPCEPEACPVVAKREFDIPFITDIEYEITCNGGGTDYNVILADNSMMIPGAQIVSREWTVNSIPSGSAEVLEIDPDPLAGESILVSLLLVDASGFKCQKDITVVVPEEPELSFTTGLSGGCINNVVAFNPISNALAGELVEWNWDFGDLSQSKLYNPIKVYSIPDNYTVTFEAITSYGCTTEVSETIHVVNTMINGEVSTDIQDCNASVILGFDQTAGGTILHYEWMPNGETTATIEVMTDGFYLVHVTDVNGCTFTTGTLVSNISEPFNFGIIPTDIVRCMGSNYALSNYVNSPYEGSWYMIPDPLNYGVDDGNVFISGNLPVGEYTIFLQAIDNMSQTICATASFPFHVNPTPTIDLAHDVIACDPFLAEVYETMNQVVEWTTLPVPPSSSILVTSRGTYGAKIINEFGCFKSTSEVVVDDIDVSFFDAGCRKECIEDIVSGAVVVNGPGPSETFDYWEWRVNGQLISSGSGIVPDLTLTEQMIGSITLYIEIGGCGKETDSHVVETMVCSNCPPDLSVETVLYEMMPVLGDENCEEYVYFIRGKYLLPPGFVFCDFYPVFDGGYVIYDEFTYTYQPPTINSVEFIAHLYITDFPAYVANNGLLGTMRLCDIDSEDICDADVEIRFMMPMMGMMCNFDHCMDCDPCVFTSTQAVPVISCMTLHFPDCGECGITEYTVTVLRDWVPIYSEQVPWNGQSINQEYCLEYDYPYAPGACFLIRLTSECGHSCLTSICLDNLLPCEQEPRHPITSQWIHDTGEEDILFAYPNPNNGDVLFINTGKTSSDVTLLTITGIDGRLVFSDIPMSGSTGSIDTKALLPGTYIISAQDAINGQRSFVRYVHMD